MQTQPPQFLPFRADFSSQGPTHVDLRIKPDVVCVGAAVNAARSDGDISSRQCGSYVGIPQGAVTIKSGTSMATPMCAGTAALIRQYVKEKQYPAHAVLPGEGSAGDVGEEPTAALVKAFMVHSGQPLMYMSHSEYLL